MIYSGQQWDGDYCATDGWYWIDANHDSVAESYCFDQEGYLLTNTTTLDGYQVNANGTWTVNGAVQTRDVKTQAYSGNPADYAGTYKMGNYSERYTVLPDHGLLENGEYRIQLSPG